MHPLDESDPTRIGRYHLVGRLGEGGMGRVYLARTPGGRPAAVKVINDRLRHDEQALTRFRREVETLGTVRSAYTAALIDAEVATPPYWLATEYVPGPTLHAAVHAEGPLPADLCRGLLAALAEGLADIHVHDVWHRDVKPHNVILSATGPQLIDFGIARAFGPSDLTQAGISMGSPGYMAPEIITGEGSGPAADVFALGATLAFAVTGRGPFGDGPVDAVAYRTVHEAIDLEGVDPDVAHLISACVHRDPEQRPDPQSIVEMCRYETDLIRHPAYQKALVVGTVAADAPGTTAAHAAGPVAGRPAAEAAGDATTVLAAPGPSPSYSPTLFAPGTPAAPGRDGGTLVYGPPSAADVPDGPRGPRRWRLPLLATAGVLVVAATVTGVLVVQESGDGHRAPAAGGTRDGGSGKETPADEDTAAGEKAPADTSASPAPDQADADLADVLVVKARSTLRAGQALRTKRTTMIMQTDGNLVVYDEDKRARWSSGTPGRGDNAVFQEDGNLVVYNSAAKPVWASNTPGAEGAELKLLADGNVVIDLAGKVLWQTRTAH